MLVVAFLAFFLSKLSFELVDSYIDASVSVGAGFGNNEDFTVFAPCDYLHADIAARLAIDKHLNLIDTIVVPGQLCSFLLSVRLDGFGYLDMFASNSKKQDCSP
jgi:hypothetical protein